MKLTKNAKRVFIFNIIMAIIRSSWGLECVKGIVWTNSEGEKIIKESDEPMQCDSSETFCATASGSFMDGDDEYVIESVQVCSSQNYCETFDAAKTLGLFAIQTDDSFPVSTYYYLNPGKTPVTRECCIEDNCNKPQETTSTSGYSIHKNSFNNIVLLFAVSAIFFF